MVVLRGHTNYVETILPFLYHVSMSGGHTLTFPIPCMYCPRGHFKIPTPFIVPYFNECEYVYFRHNFSNHLIAISSFTNSSNTGINLENFMLIIHWNYVHVDRGLTMYVSLVDFCGHFPYLVCMSSCPRSLWTTPSMNSNNAKIYHWKKWCIPNNNKIYISKYAFHNDFFPISPLWPCRKMRKMSFYRKHIENICIISCF